MRTTAKNSTDEKTDAISVLKNDHKKVKGLFKNFEKLKESGATEDLEAIVREICAELSMHSEAEERIFYPAARAAFANEGLIDEAEVEHASAEDLISQLQASSPDDPKYSATVTVLVEHVRHHIEEEQNEIFPKAKKAKMNLDSIGKEILSFKKSYGSGDSGPASPRSMRKSADHVSVKH
jgi:hemerythrin superfamily protein